MYVEIETWAEGALPHSPWLVVPTWRAPAESGSHLRGSPFHVPVCLSPAHRKGALEFVLGKYGAVAIP